jgi:hypothetical protein
MFLKYSSSGIGWKIPRCWKEDSFPDPKACGNPRAENVTSGVSSPRREDSIVVSFSADKRGRRNFTP